MTTAWCYTINIWPCVCVLYIYFLYIWFYFNCDECIWFLVHLLKVILMKSTVQEEKKVDWNICLIWWWWSSDTLFAWLYFFKKSCWMLAPSFWTGIWWISKEKKGKICPSPLFLAAVLCDLDCTPSLYRCYHPLYAAAANDVCDLFIFFSNFHHQSLDNPGPRHHLSLPSRIDYHSTLAESLAHCPLFLSLHARLGCTLPDSYLLGFLQIPWQLLEGSTEESSPRVTPKLVSMRCSGRRYRWDIIVLDVRMRSSPNHIFLHS